MADLREKLAARMDAIMQRYFGHEGAYAGYAETLADECIRQMEWARRHCCPVSKYESIEIDKTKYPGMSGIRIVGTNPLTPAPDDWKPE